MPSVPVTVAEAVKAELAGATLSLPFTATREYVPQYDLKDVDGLRVIAIPKENTITTLDRQRNSNEVSVDVGVMRKVATFTPAALDPLSDFVQEVIDFLDRRPLAGYPSAKWIRAANSPLYAPDWLKEKLVFISVHTVTYTVAR
jgi:hypothetical protein